MKHVLTLTATLALLGSPGLAASFLLDFNNGTQNVVDQGFGDNAQADLSYRAIDANTFGDVTTTGDLFHWGTGYGDLDGVAWGGPNPSRGEIRIEALDAAEFVTLNSFELGGWVADEIAEWRVFDLSWNEIASGGGIAPDVGGHLDVLPGVSVQGGLILQWGDNAWDVGIQNVSYDVSGLTPVPLPAGGMLLATGLGLLALRRRR